MDFNLLSKLVSESKMGKAQIAVAAKISRTTLDNALNGADIKISTIENLANVLGVSASIFFGGDKDIAAGNLNLYEAEIKRLQTLLNNQKNPLKFSLNLI